MPYLNFHLNNINMPAAWAVPLRSLPQVDFSCNKLTSSGLEAIASCEAISAGFKYRIFLFFFSGTWFGLMNADVWWSFRRNMLCSDGAAPHISSDHLVVPKFLVHKVKFCIHCPDLCVFKAGTAAQNGDMHTHRHAIIVIMTSPYIAHFIPWQLVSILGRSMYVIRFLNFRFSRPSRMRLMMRERVTLQRCWTSASV